MARELAGRGGTLRSATPWLGSTMIRSMPRSRIAAASSGSIPAVVMIRWTAVIGDPDEGLSAELRVVASRITSEAASIIARLASTSSNRG